MGNRDVCLDNLGLDYLTGERIECRSKGKEVRGAGGAELLLGAPPCIQEELDAGIDPADNSLSERMRGLLQAVRRNLQRSCRVLTLPLVTAHEEKKQELPVEIIIQWTKRDT